MSKLKLHYGTMDRDDYCSDKQIIKVICKCPVDNVDCLDVTLELEDGSTVKIETSFDEVIKLKEAVDLKIFPVYFEE